MATVPRLLPGTPRVSLTAEEVDILKVVDGKRPADAIAAAVGLDRLELDEALERLAMLGLVALPSSPRGAAYQGADGAAADGIELPAAARGHLDRLHAVLGQTDHYELLGLSRDADKAAVKAAYYRAGPGFHPDKLFRRQLGPYKAKIEQIFAALTRAYDTLRYAKRRAQYDAALGPPRPGAAGRRQLIAAAVAYMVPVERSAGSSAPSAPSSPTPRPSAHPSAARPPRVSSAPGASPPPSGSSAPAPPPAGASRPRISTRPPATTRSQPPKRSQLTPERLRAQRALLATKLRRRGSLPSIPPVPQPGRVAPKVTQKPVEAPQTDGVARSAAEVLRQRYQDAAGAARQRRLDRYVEQGRVAMMAGDYRAAAAAYDQALKLSPDDAQLAERAREAANLVRNQ